MQLGNTPASDLSEVKSRTRWLKLHPFHGSLNSSRVVWFTDI